MTQAFSPGRILVTLVAVAAGLAATAQGKVKDPAPCPPYKTPGMHWDASPIVDAIDTNHDGKMTHREWIAAGAPQESWDMFMSKDKSHKGYITREEFLADRPPDGIDFNCDGKITIEEFRRFAAQGPKGPPPPQKH